MAYKEGSLGVAILIGFVMFFVIDMVLGIALAPGGGAYSLIMGGPLGTGFGGIFIGMTYGVLAADGVRLLIDIFIPLVCGIVAGLIARGSAGRGFMAGFGGVLVGYFIYFLMAFVTAIALTGGAMMGFMGAAGGVMLVPIVIMILVVPIVLGIFAGIGGALMSAISATQVAGSGQAAYPVTTNIITPASSAPMVFQGGGMTQAAPAAAGATKVICPSCKSQNEQGSTFCESCGTRLKG